jgi:hypothetical protein
LNIYLYICIYICTHIGDQGVAAFQLYNPNFNTGGRDKSVLHKAILNETAVKVLRVCDTHRHTHTHTHTHSHTHTHTHNTQGYAK